MPTASAIVPTLEPGLDHRVLYDQGLGYLRAMAGKTWTDHNLHDPGITILELACYALTELDYRTRLPVEDLLAAQPQAKWSSGLFTPGHILPNRAWTALDYRKLIIDVAGVRNAWLLPDPLVLYAHAAKGQLKHEPVPGETGYRAVALKGLHKVVIEYEGEPSDIAQTRIRNQVDRLLRANRNLCEDFTTCAQIESEPFIVCAEIESSPGTDVARVQAEVRWRIEHYLSPPIKRYSLDQMLARRRADGSLPTMEDVFDGPLLQRGFIDDDELLAADLRRSIRLSDVIGLVMDIEGVRAVRDMVIAPAKDASGDKWIIPVSHGKRPVLDMTLSRIVHYKRGVPVQPTAGSVAQRYQALVEGARNETESVMLFDPPLPQGRARDIGNYVSFQRHFPSLYGLAPNRLADSGDTRRAAQVEQLRAYLLFFDQIMANHCAQLASLGELLSGDEQVERSYFGRKLGDELADCYAGNFSDTDLRKLLEDQRTGLNRRNRLLDHLIARHGERFHEYADITNTLFVGNAAQLMRTKAAFLRKCDTLGAERGLGHDATQPITDADPWMSGNVSGLEKRLAALLGIANSNRRDLTDPDSEGMFLVENILLRPPTFDDPLLHICANADCQDCADADPYSYRLHFILPAYAGRFTNFDFRRFVEDVIREETPAHILPKVCWLARDAMRDFQRVYLAWLKVRRDGPAADRAAALTALRDVLERVKSVYPEGRLFDCTADESQTQFILGHSVLGTDPSPDTP